jgi:hypothetical protein
MASVGPTINRAVLLALGMVGFYCLAFLFLFQQWKKKEEKKKTIFCCFVRLPKIAYGLLPIAIGIHQLII